MSTDPFRHHPGLRDKITDPETSWFRDISLDKIAGVLEAQGLPMPPFYDDATREAKRAAFFDGRPEADLWVFAYGSLMWDPALVFDEVRRGRLKGYHRRFILVDGHGARGTPEQPGAMAALDSGGAADGLVYRIEAEKVDAETRILWHREMIGPAYRPVMAPVDTEHGPVEALTFVADHEADMIEADLPEHKQIEYLATGKGFMGTSHEYIRGIADKFDALGIQDAEVTRLLAKVEAFKAR